MSTAETFFCVFSGKNTIFSYFCSFNNENEKEILK